MVSMLCLLPEKALLTAFGHFSLTRWEGPVPARERLEDVAAESAGYASLSRRFQPTCQTAVWLTSFLARTCLRDSCCVLAVVSLFP